MKSSAGSKGNEVGGFILDDSFDYSPKYCRLDFI